MECIEIYAAQNGHSQFRSISVFEASPVLFAGTTVSLSAPTPCETALVHEFPADYLMSWHNPPCKQYVVVLEGMLEISVHGGATQRFGQGAMFLAADLTGTGHTTRALEAGRALVLNLEA